jgi:hypothetical protein
LTPRLLSLGVFYADSSSAWVRHLLNPLTQIPLVGPLLFILLGAGIVWVITNPYKTATGFWRIVSFAFDRFTQHFAKAAVERDTNEFLHKKLFGHSTTTLLPLLKVDWVKNAADARLHTDGTIIVRMRHERDQSRNSLMALATATKHILFPHARPFLDDSLTTAVDLQVIRIFAELLGEQAQHIYATELLGPMAAGSVDALSILPFLHDIEEQGLFGQVLLQELSYLSDRLRRAPAGVDLKDEATRFVQWLHRIATRATGDDSNDLLFIETYIRMAFILAAKTETAARGTDPYVRRLGLDLAAGARSVYLLGLSSQQTRLCEQIGNAFDADDRVVRKRSTTVSARKKGGGDRVRIIHYRRNELYMPDAPFSDLISQYGVTVGSTQTALVRYVFDSRASLRIASLEARLRDKDVAWGYEGSISRFVAQGETLAVRVLEIDDAKSCVVVGLKQLQASPWRSGATWNPGDRVRVRIKEQVVTGIVVEFIQSTSSGARALMFGWIPSNEWSWYDTTSEHYMQPTLESEHDVEVLRGDERRDLVLLSRRNLEVRDWSAAKRRYQPGAHVRATVVRVNGEGLMLEMEPGVFGRITAQSVREQSFELKDFETTVVPGVRYDVVVLGAKERRKDFRLDFARQSIGGN